ncbi:MAG TPA: hypothetical protein VIE65_07360 [Methylobacter sp.]|jgi:hypothetical protein
MQVDRKKIRDEILIKILQYEERGLRFQLEEKPGKEAHVHLKRRQKNAEIKAMLWTSQNYFGTINLHYSVGSVHKFRYEYGRVNVQFKMDNTNCLNAAISAIAACISLAVPESDIIEGFPKSKRASNNELPPSSVKIFYRWFREFFTRYPIQKSGGSFFIIIPPQSSTDKLMESEQVIHLRYDMSDLVMHGFNAIIESAQRIPEVVLSRELDNLKELFESLEKKVPFTVIQSIWNEVMMSHVMEE